MSETQKICPVCSTEYPANERFCPRDGSALRSVGGSSTDLVGSIIAERYHVIKKLGEGGMGQVYLAEHVKMGRKSAVKVMNPGMVDNVDAISRFNREAANASRINHPNVAGIYDFGETADGLIYMAMEFVEGEPLTNIIKSAGHLPPMRASEISRQVAEGLSVAHEMGIVHRDLKPDNIMVGKGRQGSDMVKVVDFGIAKAAASDNQKVTKTGMVVGTPEYMSPEQLSGDPLDARSDIYSLGLVTFNMLTGKLPFPSDSMQETMIMRLTDVPKRLGDMKPDIHWPEDVQAVMDKVLARDANERYSTASQYAHDLVEAIDRMPAWDPSSAGTAVVAAMDPATAATAATIAVGQVPKTRVGTKADVVAEAPKVPVPAATAKKSNAMVFGGVGALVVAAGIGVFVMQGMGKGPGTSSVSTPPTAVPNATQSTIAAGKPADTTPKNVEPLNKTLGASGSSTKSIDDQLYDIDNRLMDETSGANADTYTQALREIAALRPKIRTRDDSVRADVMRAEANWHLNNKDAACSILAGLAGRASREKDLQGIEGVKTGAGCPIPERP